MPAECVGCRLGRFTLPFPYPGAELELAGEIADRFSTASLIPRPWHFTPISPPRHTPR
jgi:hypothetical protein